MDRLKELSNIFLKLTTLLSPDPNDKATSHIHEARNKVQDAIDSLKTNDTSEEE